KDDGEGDGVPTPGEPGVYAQPIGPPGKNILFATAVLDSGFANVQRIVATVVSDEGLVRVEKYLQSQVVQIPRSGSVYLAPGVLLNFQGSRFRVDGRDHDVFGNRVPGPQQYGLSTAVAGNPGDNAAALLAQIPAPFQDQINGRGGDPSIGEDAGGDVDIDALVDQFRANNTNELIPGTYTDLVSGNIFAGDIPVTFSGGDLVLAGNGGGAGVLVVDGNLMITGRFTFHGLIIVRGDVMLTGGGTRISVIGSTIIGQSLNALDEADLSVLGEAELLYSSRVLDAVQSVLDTRPTYEGVYYDEN
ncbi:MAG: hypothetical protein O7J95_07450, partial [Planctomycetota bacterium]|nr:hypothetical protein [Planctomycetota bacterium]